jgi:DNA-binding response OmpR family regulator
MNPSTQQTVSKKVLIIEDDAAMAEVICAHLREAGFSASSALSTRLAALEIKNNPPDALILDLNLEGENGLDYLPKFKSENPKVPVLILTGEGYENHLIETALQNGASAYFSKESGIESVPALIARLLNPKPLP